MHLADRSCGERCRLDRLEHVFPGDAQVLFHHANDVRLGKRRDAIAQLG